MTGSLRAFLIGIAVLIVVLPLYWYFYYIWGTHAVYAEFDRAAGLKPRDDVTMANIRIGSVRSLMLTPRRKAQVLMLVRNRYRDFIPADSVARIAPIGPITKGRYAVEITPGAAGAMIEPGAYLASADSPDLQQLMADATTLAATMQRSFDSADALLGDRRFQAALRNSTMNMETASRQSVVLIGDLQTLLSERGARIPGIMSDIENTAGNFEVISRDLRQTTSASKPALKAIVSDTARSAADLRTISSRLKAVSDGIDPKDAARILASAKTATTDLEAVAQHLRVLSEDPDLSTRAEDILADLEKAVIGAAEVVDMVKELIEKQ